jgi:hypothetical protein
VVVPYCPYCVFSLLALVKPDRKKCQVWHPQLERCLDDVDHCGNVRRQGFLVLGQDALSWFVEVNGYKIDEAM